MEKFFGYLFKGLAVAAGFFVLLVLAATFSVGKKGEPSQTAVENPEAPILIPSALVEAYQENSVAADQRFKGFRYRVAGWVSDINTDVGGTPYITMEVGPNVIVLPQFRFSKDAIPELAKLKKGTAVMVECVGAGDIMKVPISRNCILQ